MRRGVVEWTALDSRGQEQLEHRGEAGKKCPCSICRVLVVVPDGKSTFPYVGGYGKLVRCWTANGMLECYVGDERLYMTHVQSLLQGSELEQIKKSVRERGEGASAPRARLDEMRRATGCDGNKYLVHTTLPWTSAQTFFLAAPLHTGLLGNVKDYRWTIYQGLLGYGGFKALKMQN